MFQRRSRTQHNFPCRLNLPRVLLSSPRESLVSLVSVQFGNDIVDGFVNVELFTAEHVDKRRVPVGEGVYADVAFCDDDESADTPLSRILAWSVDERVRRTDLVHADHVWKLV